MLLDTATTIKNAEGMELRAGERVLQYLLTEFDRPQLKEGSRLPTNKELAQKLNVSPGTVQSVLRQLTQEGRIRTRRGSGTFLVPKAERPSENFRIAVTVPVERLQIHDGWLSRIGGGMFHTALQRQATLEGIAPKAAGTDALIEELMDKKSKIDALIMMPYTVLPKHDFLVEAYEKEGKPVVHVHPPSVTATANFVSTDYFTSSFDLGRVWRETGRQRVVMLTNHSGRNHPREAVSHFLRHMGLTSGFAPDLRESVQYHTVGVENISEEYGYHGVRQLLAKSETIPDAIYCAGDWLALGAFKALQESGLRVPEEVSLVGVSGMELPQARFPNLTRVRHDLDRLGSTAIEMALRRIEMKGISVPGVVLPTSFIGGISTRASENALLGIDPLAANP